MKKSKIIVPALGILVLSTAASITGTVAWFSVNNSVTVDGMSVHTRVDSNLLIAETNTSDDNYGAALTQGRVGTLEPASSVNGVAYFYSTDANPDGSKHKVTSEVPYVAYNESTSQAHAAAGKTAYDSAFNEAYLGAGVSVTTSNVVYGYIDYSFYLRAQNVDSSNTAEIRMTKCNLLYNGAAINSTDHSDAALAWRVAVFAKDTTKENNISDEVAAGNQKGILGLDGADYFTGTTASDFKAVSSATDTAAVVNFGQNVKVKTGIAASATVYEKVTVRLWLEGEDESCNNATYAALTNAWTLDLGFAIATTGAAETAVNEISSAL